MGFTRISDDLNIIQGLSDLPNETDGLSAAQLKAKFDQAGNTLKTATNGLMGELEGVSAASYLGANQIVETDDSDANIQAKLEKLYNDMQSITQGAVADGSITEAKLASALKSVLAKKNGNLQTDLNSEKVGGKTIADIADMMAGYFKMDSYVGAGTSSPIAQQVIVGFEPRVLFIITSYTSTTSPTDRRDVWIFIDGDGLRLASASSNLSRASVGLTETGFDISDNNLRVSGRTYKYFAIK